MRRPPLARGGERRRACASLRARASDALAGAMSSSDRPVSPRLAGHVAPPGIGAAGGVSARAPGTWAELGLVVTWWATSIAFCWVAGVPWILANPLVLGVPLAYLLYRHPALRPRVRWSFIAKYVVFVSVFFDYLCVRYGGWGGPSSLP